MAVESSRREPSTLQIRRSEVRDHELKEFFGQRFELAKDVSYRVDLWCAFAARAGDRTERRREGPLSVEAVHMALCTVSPAQAHDIARYSERGFTFQYAPPYTRPGD